MSPPTSEGLPAIKRKRDTPSFHFAHSSNRPAHPDSLLSMVSQAQRYLQERRDEKTFDEIKGYLSIQHSDPTLLRQFERVLQGANPKVMYNKSGAGGKGTFKYKPDIPVTNAEELKAYLQRRTDSIGVKYQTIEDGWPKAMSVDKLHRMSKGHEVLLSRDKKGEIRAVWQNDPTLHHDVAKELLVHWASIPMPANADDVRDKLVSAGLKPTSAPRQVIKGTLEKKKKAVRKTGKTTNTHIQHLLKDYSKKRL